MISGAQRGITLSVFSTEIGNHLLVVPVVPTEVPTSIHAWPVHLFSRIAPWGPDVVLRLISKHCALWAVAVPFWGIAVNVEITRMRLVQNPTADSRCNVPSLTLSWMRSRTISPINNVLCDLQIGRCAQMGVGELERAGPDGSLERGAMAPVTVPRAVRVVHLQHHRPR
jgi:hypothetical protein